MFATVQSSINFLNRFSDFAQFMPVESNKIHWNVQFKTYVFFKRSIYVSILNIYVNILSVILILRHKYIVSKKKIYN